MKKKSMLILLLLLTLIHSIILVSENPISTTSSMNSQILSVQECDIDLNHFKVLSERSDAYTLRQKYVQHEPIVIEDNADFAALGFTGDGSLDNPYIIEGLNITSKAQILIHIQDTISYFCIRNNLLNGLRSAGDGISMERVIYGTIDSNIIINCRTGIDIFESNQCIVTHNTISQNGDGIVFEMTDQNTAIHNTISQNTYGILVMWSNHTTVANNNVSNNHWEGISLRASGNNNVSNNFVANNSYGIYLMDTCNTTVAHNIVSKNRLYGIYIHLEIHLPLTSGDNIIKRNNILGNNPGNGSQASDDGTNNIFTSNYWDDHDNTDLNSDGFADAPYTIEGTVNNQDPCPLSVPAVIEIITLSKVPEFEGYFILVVIHLLFWLRKQQYRIENKKRTK